MNKRKKSELKTELMSFLVTKDEKGDILEKSRDRGFDTYSAYIRFLVKNDK